MSTTAEILKAYGQDHILELLSAGKSFPQLDKIDLERLLKNVQVSILPKSTEEVAFSGAVIEALPVEDIQSIEDKKDTLTQSGMDQLREKKLAVVILSGGQGSRLGFDHAKGMYDVGLTKSISIFELLVNSLSQLSEKVGAPIPLFIMTSTENNEEVQAFFHQHQCFGYPEESIDYFVQNQYPALDGEGNIYLTHEGKTLMLPSGNGDWYQALAGSGVLEKPQFQSVEWFNVVSVDNPLQNMADPVFLGATIGGSCEAGAKVIRKAVPEEKVGTICKVGGKPGIIEYYELPDELKYEKNESGEYKYQYGVTLNYLFHKPSLDACLDKTLPLHYVNKNVRVDEEHTVGLIKAETLILDMISFFDSACVFEIIREKEFAPIKNRVGVDSVDTARALLEQNGIQL